MKKRLFLGVFFFIYLLRSLEIYGTTLDESVRVALETNPSISADEAAVRASEWDIDLERSGYYPSVDLTATGGYQHTRIKNKLSSLSFPLDGHANRVVTNPAATITQTIFDGEATTFAVARAKEQANTERSILGQTQEQIAFDAVRVYVNLLAQQRLLSLAIENIEKHKEILEKVKKRLTGGISTIADVYQVESRLEDAYIIKDRIEGQLEVAEAEFVNTIGLYPDVLESPSLPPDLLSSNIDALLVRVYQKNPGIVLATARIRVAEAALDETTSPFLPTLQAQVGANAPVLNANGTKGRQSTYTAQFIANYNLYRGGRDMARHNAQRERVVEAKKRLAIARREAEKQAHTAWGRFISARQQVEDATIAVQVDEKLQRAYLIQFELVSRPLVDLLDAYVSYFRAKTDLINAEADKSSNFALLLSTMGELACLFCNPRYSEYLQKK